MKLKLTPLQIAFELLAALLLAALVGFLACNWQQIPAEIPRHYNTAGQPDAWGGKGSLIGLAAVGMGLYTLLTALSFFPAIWNIPVKVTQENRLRVYTQTRTLLCWLKLVLAAVFAYLAYCSAAAAPLGGLFLPVTLLAVFGGLGVNLVFIIKGSRVPRSR